MRPRRSPATELRHRTWDVVVVGAGPAGCDRRGAPGPSPDIESSSSTVMRFPRDKVCGDGLIADSLGALERLTALPAGQSPRSSAGPNVASTAPRATGSRSTAIS